MASILGVVQARMGSTRLPGKILRDLGGRSVLARVVWAATASGVLDDLVVATTQEPIDDAVVAECDRLGVKTHRGPTDDVLTRFIGALDAHPHDSVMRFTADCPFLDLAIIEMVANAFQAIASVDYITSSIVRTLPRGLDAEIISAAALRRADALATDYHRTHVTSYVYTNPDQFRVLGLTALPDRSHLRLTLDTPEDWELAVRVVEEFGDQIVPLVRLASWLGEHPEVAALNEGVEQKALAEA